MIPVLLTARVVWGLPTYISRIEAESFANSLQRVLCERGDSDLSLSREGCSAALGHSSCLHA